MDNDRLEELKRDVKFMAKACIEHGLEPDYVDTSADICQLIDKEIERRSVMDEEVVRSIIWNLGLMHYLQDRLNNSGLYSNEDRYPIDLKSLNTAVHALKDWRPKKPCDFCEFGFEGEASSLGSKGWMTLMEDEINFCPNCGRELE